MVKHLEEPAGTKFPCPIHRTVKTTAKLNSEGTFYIVTCPVCGVCTKVPT